MTALDKELGAEIGQEETLARRTSRFVRKASIAYGVSRGARSAVHGRFTRNCRHTLAAHKLRVRAGGTWQT